MSKGLEIADERLARGEISEDEYDKLVAKLGENSSDVPRASSPQSVQDSRATEEFSISKHGAIGWMATPAVIFAIMMFVMPDNLVGLTGKGILFFVVLACAFLFGLLKQLLGK